MDSVAISAFSIDDERAHHLQLECIALLSQSDFISTVISKIPAACTDEKELSYCLFIIGRLSVQGVPKPQGVPDAL